MTHREKVDLFISEMARRGVNEAMVAPPAWRTAWRLGLKVPPPHFLGFIPMALTSGLFFGVPWAVAMWFLIGRSQSWTLAAVAGLGAGTLFGVCFAAYYRYLAAKLKLPKWQQYPDASP